MPALMARVGRPSHSEIEEFRAAGMDSVRVHVLTEAERAKVEAALASLPPLHKDALLSHLHQLAFVDGIPGEGTGLTSPAVQNGMFDMTFRASLIDEALPTFLTTKEKRVFADDGSGVTVTVTGTGANALTYVLLHESAHVLDGGCAINKTLPNAYDMGIWTEQHQMTAEISHNPATQTYFHQGQKLPLSQAANTYDALAKTPFVSLYATAAATEDFAELIAWRELQQQYGGSLKIEVDDPRSGQKRSWTPLSFPLVKERFSRIDALEALDTGCPKAV